MPASFGLLWFCGYCAAPSGAAGETRRSSLISFLHLRLNNERESERDSLGRLSLCRGGGRCDVAEGGRRATFHWRHLTRLNSKVASSSSSSASRPTCLSRRKNLICFARLCAPPLITCRRRWPRPSGCAIRRAPLARCIRGGDGGYLIIRRPPPLVTWTSALSFACRRRPLTAATFRVRSAVGHFRRLVASWIIISFNQVRFAALQLAGANQAAVASGDLFARRTKCVATCSSESAARVYITFKEASVCERRTNAQQRHCFAAAADAALFVRRLSRAATASRATGDGAICNLATYIASVSQTDNCVASHVAVPLGWSRGGGGTRSCAAPQQLRQAPPQPQRNDLRATQRQRHKESRLRSSEANSLLSPAA